MTSTTIEVTFIVETGRMLKLKAGIGLTLKVVMKKPLLALRQRNGERATRKVMLKHLTKKCHPKNPNQNVKIF